MLNPFRMLAAIFRNTENIMAAQDDMTAAIGGLTTAVTASNAKIDALVSQLAAGAKASGMDDATVEGFVSQITGVTAGINAELAKVAPTPDPTPAPEPAPGPTGS